METNEYKAYKLLDESWSYTHYQKGEIRPLIKLAATPDELPTVDEQLKVIQEICHPYPNISVTELNAAGHFIMSSKPPVPDISIPEITVPKVIAPKISISDTQLRVLDHLKSSQSLGIEDVARALSINLLVTWDALDILISMGLIEPTGQGSFDVTEKGKTYKNI